MFFWKKKPPQPASSAPDVPDVKVAEANPVIIEEAKEEANEASWLQRLSQGLSQSTQKLTQGVVDVVTKRPLDQESLDALEEALIAADLGPQLAARLVADFASARFGKDVSEQEVRHALAAQIADILHPVAKNFEINTDQTKPFVMLMVGVNGSGKTTTIGKLAQQFTAQQSKVILAAGDTFRAAAVEQLQIWGKRTGATVIAKEMNSDAAAVAFEALQQAESMQADIVMIDTAGRLHNKSNLMDELAKIRRVIQKTDVDAPHLTLLTLDATLGQNAIAQVEEFNKIVPLSGLIVTKLDGSAKAGVVVGLAAKFKLPIFAIGVGEGVDDLQPFDAVAFARALMGV